MANDQRRRMQGKVFPIHGRRCPRLRVRLPVLPGTRQPSCGGVAKGAAPGSRVKGRGRGAGFLAWPLPPSCLAEYTSVTACRMPGVMEQDLRWSEAWLGKCQHLSGVIRAVVAGQPPQAHCRGRGWGEHLAKPQRGAGRRVVGWINLAQQIFHFMRRYSYVCSLVQNFTSLLTSSLHAPYKLLTSSLQALYKFHFLHYCR
jgi:hypothetical protein